MPTPLAQEVERIKEAWADIFFKALYGDEFNLQAYLKNMRGDSSD